MLHCNGSGWGAPTSSALGWLGVFVIPVRKGKRGKGEGAGVKQGRRDPL